MGTHATIYPLLDTIPNRKGLFHICAIMPFLNLHDTSLQFFLDLWRFQISKYIRGEINLQAVMCLYQEMSCFMVRDTTNYVIHKDSEAC